MSPAKSGTTHANSRDDAKRQAEAQRRAARKAARKAERKAAKKAAKKAAREAAKTGAKNPSRPEQRATAGKRTASIARSIARSIWLRRLLAFLLLDACLAAVLLGSFVVRCNSQMPEGTFIRDVIPSVGVSAKLNLGAEQPYYQVTIPDGQKTTFPLSDMSWYATPIAVLVGTFEAAGLVSGAFATKRIRRKLKPLNDLALTAEALGSVVADTEKIESLERAIASASVDSPQVKTGDADLQSIEVALNGLLRRMQEAKVQQMRFVSDASHELRTPIAVIQGYVGMLDRWGKTDEEVLDESIEALKSETARMKELVEQLLFLARGDSGRTTLNRTTFNLAEMVEEVWEESSMIDPDHTYTLSAAHEVEKPVNMSGDVGLVKQSMRAIVQNAAKYSPAGSRIQLWATTDPGTGEAVYGVQDEGVGMSPQDVSRAFERFWRSDEARTSTEGGTGLGLSIVKWIVDAHGGSVSILSSEGVGTRFTVSFPGLRSTR